MMTNEETRYALQIQVNSGSYSAYWRFDEDFTAYRDELSEAWQDLDEARELGYSESDLRVVAITPLEAMRP